MLYDAIIIGAGPAGATLARLLGPERSVLLLDGRLLGKGEEQDGRFMDKCCGGLLANRAVKALQRMGLQLPVEVLEPAQPKVVRGIDLYFGYERSYPMPIINMCRAKFERWLLSLLPESVTLMEGRRCLAACQESGPQGDVWRVSVAGGESYAGRMLVGADGAASFVRRKVLRQKPDKRRVYLAVQDVYPLPPSGAAEREHLALFHPRLTDFYAWAIPKQEHWLVGAAFPLARAGKAYMTPRAGMDFLQRELLGRGYLAGLAPNIAVPRESCLLLRPGPGDIALGRALEGEAPVFCIGEAAGLISHSSAEGISYALASAQGLAQAMLSGGSGPQILSRYGRATRGLAAGFILKQCKSAIMYNPTLRHMIMRSGMLSV